eukprot:scaffold101009_cov63-Phaeocystis_antarctica.AAC.6
MTASVKSATPSTVRRDTLRLELDHCAARRVVVAILIEHAHGEALPQHAVRTLVVAVGLRLRGEVREYEGTRRAAQHRERAARDAGGEADGASLDRVDTGHTDGPRVWLPCVVVGEVAAD